MVKVQWRQDHWSINHWTRRSSDLAVSNGPPPLVNLMSENGFPKGDDVTAGVAGFPGSSDDESQEARPTFPLAESIEDTAPDDGGGKARRIKPSFSCYGAVRVGTEHCWARFSVIGTEGKKICVCRVPAKNYKTHGPHRVKEGRQSPGYYAPYPRMSGRNKFVPGLVEGGYYSLSKGDKRMEQETKDMAATLESASDSSDDDDAGGMESSGSEYILESSVKTNQPDPKGMQPEERTQRALSRLIVHGSYFSLQGGQQSKPIKGKLLLFLLLPTLAC